MSNPPSPLSYRGAGVDIDAGHELVKRIAPLAKKTARAGVLGGLGGFGGLFDIAASGYADGLLVAGNDGVGTKVKLAIAANQHDTIGIDLVAMSANDVLVQGAEPLFFLDYFACGQLDVGVAEVVIAGIAAGCEQAGCALIGGETAEMPDMYHGQDYELAGFCVGAVARDGLLPKLDELAAGDVLIGLASSGLHANGFSLVRQVIKTSGAKLDAVPPFASPHKTLADALLVPTKIYVAPILGLLKAGHPIKALCHITGGGLVDNLPRILPEALQADIRLDDVPKANVFEWLQAQSALGTEDFLRVFNGGVGMVMIVKAGTEDSILAALREYGEAGFVLGQLQKRAQDSRAVHLTGHF